METFDFEKEIVEAIPKLKRFGLRLTYDPIRTEDLVQEVLLKALLKKDSFKTHEKSGTISTWLCTILHNLLVDQQRASKKYSFTRIYPGNEYQVDQLGKHTNPSCELDAQLISEQVNQLKGAPKAVVQLMIQGHSYEEIAILLDIPINTMKGRLRNGRIRLAKRLRPLGFPQPKFE